MSSHPQRARWIRSKIVDVITYGGCGWYSRKSELSINSSDMEAIKDITKFSQGSFPFRYLGIPVADSRLRISQYSPLIDKITNYISAWAGANLSYAGRTELVKLVLQGVECFWLSILPILAGVKAKIVQLCRNFLRSGNCNSHKRPLVAWEEVTLPKSEGGLGIREISKPGIRLSSQKPCGTFRRRRIPSGFNRDEIIAAEDNVEGAIQRINQWTSNGDFQSKKAYDYFRPRRAKLAWPKMGDAYHKSSGKMDDQKRPEALGYKQRSRK
ncbi:hypothetical protein Acr_03g0005640 [Actinidia rufa]|uniref:Uncharacterized protein n=1 Tax=Actinidia rufa TaxID=165716 RepID=A0A7J0EBM2_9ERIC|nr:hypothetical protein Acr_03g0005640 [Actinidia rufa]